jgi:hypothetical protein
MKLITLVVLLLSFPSFAAAQCVTQDYSSKTEPAYDCPGPDEDAIIPKLEFKMSVGLDKDKPAPFAGVLLESNQVIQLGIRIKGLRRLRYLDMQKAATQQKIELDFAAKLAKADQDLLTSQRESYKAQVVELREDLKSAQAWYRSWTFGFVLGTLITTTAAVSLAISVK